MSDGRLKVEQLLQEAEELPYGDAKVDLLQQAVLHADALEDIELAFSTRRMLIQAATFSGHHEALLVAFAWCLAQQDRDPERFGTTDATRGSWHDLMWQYKWVLNATRNFPDVSLQRIENLLGDFERRCKLLGVGERSVYLERRSIAEACGHVEAAKQWHSKWQGTRRDYLSDCLACERNSTVGYLAFIGEHKRAIEYAAPILRGKLSCGHIPHWTYATILESLFELKKFETAMEYHKKGIRMIARNREFLYAAAEHMWFLTVTGNLNEALRVYQKFVFGMGKNDLRFMCASLGLFSSLKHNQRAKLRMRLPRTAPLFHESGTYETAALVDWFHGAASELAHRFDRRNQNTYASSQVIKAQSDWERVVPFAVKKEKEAE